MLSYVSRLYLDNKFHKHYKRILYNLKTYKLIVKSAREVQRLVPTHCDEVAFAKAIEIELLQHDRVVRERYIPIYYKEVLIQQLRLDIEFRGFIVELKTLERMTRKNELQLRAYLEHTDYKKGILLNFNTKTLHIDYLLITRK